MQQKRIILWEFRPHRIFHEQHDVRFSLQRQSAHHTQSSDVFSTPQCFIWDVFIISYSLSLISLASTFSQLQDSQMASPLQHRRPNCPNIAFVSSTSEYALDLKCSENPMRVHRNWTDSLDVNNWRWRSIFYFRGLFLWHFPIFLDEDRESRDRTDQSRHQFSVFTFLYCLKYRWMMWEMEELLIWLIGEDQGIVIVI